MPPIQRRQFLGGAAAVAAAPRIVVTRAGKPWRPNDEIRAAVIGIKSRGQAHIGGMHRQDGVRVVAVSDCDSAFLDREKKKFDERGESLDTHVDMREVFDRDDIDVVTSATPNHWHSLLTIWACQAGKDVYIEKPVSHNVWEGRQMVTAARKYDRIVQAGTQARSSHAIRDAIAWIQAGNLGAIQYAQGLCYKPRRSIGKVDGPQEPPKTVDYDLWLGPAEERPLTRRSLHYDWHWDFNTGNGDMGNQGIHQMDICRWALGHDSLSSRVLSVGGRLGYDDDGDTPNTQISFHEFPDGPPILFEVRGLPQSSAAQEDKWQMDDVGGVRIGNWIHCENGALKITSSYGGAQAFGKDGELVKQWKGSDDHYVNFVEAVRSRDASKLNGEILEGHLSSALCHTGNISHLVGGGASPEELRELVRGRGPATDACDRMVAHLDANGVALDVDRLTAGALLEMDPRTERFTNHPGANRLLRREPRAPFAVPEEV